MKTRILALALCLSLLLTGCESMLHGEYLTVEPHSMLSAAEDDSSVIRVENYQELVSGILSLVSACQEQGVIQLSNYNTRDVEADLTAACLEVSHEDPLGAYAVDYIKHEFSRILTYYQATITIGYRRTLEQIRSDMVELVIKPIIPEELLDENTKYYVNPTGRFVKGGPAADSGLTGRKIIVDTYGGSAPHGGGAFSGKDPTKVDRSAAYAARWVAKNIVAAGLARKCQVQLAYAIGVAHPVSVMVETFGTGKVSDERLEKAVRKVFDLRPSAIIRDLDLRKPIYRQLAAYGHMGREDLGVTWEKTDRVEAIKAALED